MFNKQFILILMVTFFLLWSLGTKYLHSNEDKTIAEKGVDRSPVAVDSLKVSPSDINDSIEVIGTLTAKYHADVKAELSAIVKKVYVTEWVKVKKGDKLASLDNRDTSTLLNKAQGAISLARANLLQAKVAKDRAQREYKRVMSLKESGLATQQNLDDLKSENEAAQARHEAAQAQLNVSEQELEQVRVHLAKSEITAPINGIVATCNVNLGDLVGEAGSNKVIFKIVDNRLLDLTAVVPSKDMGKLKVGQDLTFSTDAFPGKIFSGKIMFINPAVDETDRSIKIIAQVPNENEELKSGLFVKGKIIISNRSNILQLPRSSFLRWDIDQKKADLFVIQEDIAKIKEVKTGAVNGDMVEIISGLKAFEEVIIRGGFNLKDGDKVKTNRSI